MSNDSVSSSIASLEDDLGEFVTDRIYDLQAELEAASQVYDAELQDAADEADRLAGDLEQTIADLEAVIAEQAERIAELEVER